LEVIVFDNPAYLVVVVAVLAAGAPFLFSLSDRQRAKALDRYARQVNLALTPEVRPRVVARIVARERAFTGGGLVGTLLGLGVGLTLPSEPAVVGEGPGPLLAVPIGLIVGATIATVFTSVASTLRPGIDRRIARPTAPALEDYVPPMERWFAPLTLACAVLALAGGVIALATGVLHSPDLQAADLLRSTGSVLLYAAVLAFAGGRPLARRVLEAAQPASSEQELAWDDALRSSTLRGIVQLPSVLAAASVTISFFEIGARTVDQPMIIGLLGVLGLTVFLTGSAVLLAMDLGGRPRQHYWRRLWRAGQPAGAR
jgi:hypothetical protein